MPSKSLKVPGVGIDLGDGRITISGPIPRRPAWCFQATYERPAGGGLVLTALEVFSCDYEIVDGRRRILSVPPGGLSTATVRLVPIADLFDDLSTYTADDSGRLLIELFAGVSAEEMRKRPGRAGRDDRHYAELAEAYVDLSSTSRRPVADLAKMMRFDPVTVRDKLAEARKRGLLASFGPGRSGGRLTAKAMDLLQRKGDVQ